MLKVLHYIPGFLYGGIETMFLSWYRCIENKNVEFELLYEHRMMMQRY